MGFERRMCILFSKLCLFFFSTLILCRLCRKAWKFFGEEKWVKSGFLWTSFGCFEAITSPILEFLLVYLLQDMAWFVIPNLEGLSNFVSFPHDRETKVLEVLSSSIERRARSDTWEPTNISIPHHRLIEARAIMLLVTTPRFEPRSIGGRAYSRWLTDVRRPWVWRQGMQSLPVCYGCKQCVCGVTQEIVTW